jgi:hypothetical protein
VNAVKLPDSGTLVAKVHHTNFHTIYLRVSEL